MTQPPYGPPAGEPHDPQGWQHPGWEQPQQGWQQPPSQPGWEQQGWQQPQPGWQPPPQQPGWEQQGWQPPQQPGWEQQPSAGYPVQQPQPAKGRGKWIAAAAAVVVVAGGGVATYVAVSDSNSHGAASPKQAVQKIVDDLNNSDLVGVLDDLAPGESAALSKPFLDEVGQLKRLKVLKSSADPKHVSGVKFAVKQLSFDSKTITINNRVQIVQLTGGTLDISADAAKAPVTREFLDAAFPHGLPANSRTTHHVDIAAQVKRDGHPIRIATQRVGDSWYPSIAYTIVDAAAKRRVPSASDAIPAQGAGSAQDAVRQEIDRLLTGDYAGAIKLLSPDELGAVHDYAGLLLGSHRAGNPSGMKIDTLDLTSTGISGGQRVGLKEIVLSKSDGSRFELSISGSCYDITTDGDHKHVCASDEVDQVVQMLQSFGIAHDVTDAQRQALAHLIASVAKVGIDTSQSGGKWYVNPVRSYADVSTTLLSGLQGDDLLQLIRFFQGVN